MKWKQQVSPGAASHDTLVRRVSRPLSHQSSCKGEDVHDTGVPGREVGALHQLRGGVADDEGVVDGSHCVDGVVRDCAERRL